MNTYFFHWILELNGSLYLATDKAQEVCNIKMTAKSPKRVSRTISINVNPDNLFVLYESSEGDILWKEDIKPRKNDSGIFEFDITDILRKKKISFDFCKLSRYRGYKARPYRMEKYMEFYDAGFIGIYSGMGEDSTDTIRANFFPGKCYICDSEIKTLSFSSLWWGLSFSGKGRYMAEIMRSPIINMDESKVSEFVEELGYLTHFFINNDKLSISIHMFFMSSFEISGFGKNWSYKINKSMFQPNGNAPCETSRFGPLIAKLLSVKTENELEQVLQWGIEEHFLDERSNAT